MPSINHHLFAASAALSVNGVVLRADDDVSAHREKLARIVLDELYEFVGLLDASGRVLEVNRAALNGAGITLDDIQGKPFWATRWWAVSQEAQEAQHELLRRAGEGHFVRCDAEIYGRESGEETIIIDYSLKPIFDREGNVVFLLPEGRNITDKKRAEAEIARKNEELQRLLDRIRRLDDAKSAFFANVSHELRTPLALILGPVDTILAEGENLTMAQKRDLDVIRRNAMTLLKHVNSLLDFAKVDAGKMILNYARADMAHLVRKAAAHFDAMAPQRAISFVVETPEILQAQIDPEKCERIVLNLLSNAFKFTPDGGRIRLSVQPAGETRLLLSVLDSGPGVPNESRARVFDRFEQAETADIQTSGTGLGLAITKEFVELHGGTISVSDGPRGGALFQVELPLYAPAGVYVPPATVPAPVLPVAGPAAAQAAGRPVVLVAEDNDDMRRFITEALGPAYHVIGAADGAQALAIAVTSPPDLVVTDLMMPGLPGDQFIARLRARAALAQIPVLVLSAKADEDLRVKLLAESVQDYVTKPFSAHELRARARNLVMMKRTREALQNELASQNDDITQLTHQLITSRRALQLSHDALAESEQRWRAVYESSAAGIALTDFSGRILAANQAFQAMLGYTEAELRHISVADLTPVEDRESVSARLADLVRGEVNEYHVQRRYLRKDASVLWASVSVSAVPGTEMMPPMLVRVTEDMTARRRAQDELAAAQAELARVTRATAMGELVASIAHEVNQPLAAMVANGQICQRGLAAVPKNEEEVRKAVERIIRDANRASDIIARIRNFLKRDDGTRVSVDAAAVVEDVVDMVREAARMKQVAVTITAEPDLPRVAADRVQLLQVILNLVMNGIEAMEATPLGGRALTVALRGETQGQVRFDVLDTGPGFDPAQQDYIFDAFHTTKPEGLGMGLAIARSIVEAHGGTLAARLREGGGAVFSFTMQAVAEPP